jgi:hypothetical protein
MTPPLLEETFYTRLQSNPTVSGLVDHRIFPVNQVASPELPLLTYQRISTTPFPVLSGTNSLIAARLQVSAWASTYGESKTLADAVKTALDGIDNTTFQNEVDRFDSDVDLNYTVLDFTVWNS